MTDQYGKAFVEASAISKCRYCDQTIAWLVSSSGKNYCVNADMTKKENGGYFVGKGDWHSKSCPNESGSGRST